MKENAMRFTRVTSALRDLMEERLGDLELAKQRS